MAGSIALPTAASAASPAHRTRTAARQAAAPAAQPPKACPGATRSNPVAVTLRGVRSAYAAGGRWSTLRLSLHNGTRAVCGQLRPVLVYGARNRTLRPDAVRLQTRIGGHWRSVTLNAALGELAGTVGPTNGLRLAPGRTVMLTVRMRLAAGAPRGEWLSLAVAYAPLQSKGTTVTWPVGVTNPAYFRVVGGRGAARAT
ncbi:hypothetical protein DN069_07335 [Streptacidiphilus pinicola]|uniref:Uncharacterized protein n=1 Tax=Streptacidiphilus pinicola TaxID=2219663 RepID=A0A2X0J7M9_9ACTN|nr:hypothetical protein [Streptacidiphilus pinicola]RAG86266.1 hypothetical protein DN069_07335 [Streptacidiphilus pinicola]